MSDRKTAYRFAALLIAVCLAGPLLADEIHIAAQTGDLQQVTALLAENPDLVDAEGERGMPLHAAVFSGHAEVVKYLLDHGADPDAAEPQIGFTPLHLCVYSDNLSLGDLLVAAGADIDARNLMGLSPLDLSIAFGKTEAVDFFVAHGADVEDINGHDHRPLTYAAGQGRKAIVETLLEAGAKIEARNSQGETALTAATIAGRSETVELLLTRGARVDVCDTVTGRPLLHHACLAGHLDIVEMILAAGADVKAPDADGRTALHFAARYGHQQVAKQLQAHGAASAQDLEENFGPSPLLRRKPAAAEAVAWYLNNRGWAVRTRDYLLVFDAEEFGVIRPTDPVLANGFLSAGELAGQHLLGLYTCYHGDPGELARVHKLADKMAAATYLHLQDDRFREGPNCVYLAPGEQREIDGAKVRTINAEIGNPALAYLLDVDGMSIYYQGFGPGDPEQFKLDLNGVLGGQDRVDLAFLPIPEPDDENGADSALFFHILATLQPQSVCLLDPDRRENLFPEIARQMAAKGFKGEVFCAKYPGDHRVFGGAGSSTSGR